MKIYKNYSLKKLNTFRVNVKAKYFVEVYKVSDLKQILNNVKFKKIKKYIIGDAANILFVNDFEGLIIKNSIKGIKVIEEDDESQVWEIGSGENWNKIVEKAVGEDLGGIENLISIPGTVGAAPVQNIAAYGQNFSEVFVSLDAINLESGELKKFNNKDCEFFYRESIFKNRLNNKFFIIKVRIRLQRASKPDTSYFETGNTYKANVSLAKELETFAKKPYKVSDIAKAVKNIRYKKLPDTANVGTAGSVFKNPVVSFEKYKTLQKLDPLLQCYPVDQLRYSKIEDLENESQVKLPAGRLLDFISWKGKKSGNVGTYPTHALTVVNYGAKPTKVYDFILKMKKTVLDEYGIELELEIRLVE